MTNMTAVDRATSHFPVMKPKLSSMEFESRTRRNPVKSEFISQLQFPDDISKWSMVAVNKNIASSV